MSSSNVASYVQPLSVPIKKPVYISINDPRNNSSYLNAHPEVIIAADSTLIMTDQGPTIVAKTSFLKSSPIAPNASYLASSPTVNLKNDLNSINLTSPSSPYSDQATRFFSSPTILGQEDTDPLSKTLTSDFPSIAQPVSAIPAPTFALDFPENLYIDPSLFKLLPPASDGSVTYQASLRFDDVDGATKYNYRLVIVA